MSYVAHVRNDCMDGYDDMPLTIEYGDILTSVYVCKNTLIAKVWQNGEVFDVITMLNMTLDGGEEEFDYLGTYPTIEVALETVVSNYERVCEEGL